MNDAKKAATPFAGTSGSQSSFFEAVSRSIFRNYWIARSGFFANVLLKDIRGLFSRRESTGRMLVHLDIEPTNICNANCVFCGYQYQDGKTYKSINFDFAGKILDAFCQAGGGDIGLTPVVGDPLICKDIEKLVALCRSRSEVVGIGLTTNGLLLTGSKFLALREAGLTDINISMTYPDEQEYEAIYRTNQFKRLLSNLNELALVDTSGVRINLWIRTPRLFWKRHPLLKKLRSCGWSVNRNFFFDDWSGRVAKGLAEQGLARRPLRGKHLPCGMLQSGPHAMASGRITACGCRDLEAKSELAAEELFRPFYESGDLKKVYYGTLNGLRKQFLEHNAPSICKTCRHYNPDFRFGTFKDRLAQIAVDIKAVFRSDP